MNGGTNPFDPREAIRQPFHCCNQGTVLLSIGKKSHHPSSAPLFTQAENSNYSGPETAQIRNILTNWSNFK